MKTLKSVMIVLIILLLVSNLFTSYVVYKRFVKYEKNFRIHKIMLDSYVSNHSYSLGKVYRVINRRSDLPNGYHSYIVRGVRIIDGSLQDDSFVEEIDVPGENLNYYTHDDNKNSSRLEFIMVIYTEGEHKTIFFNNESSLLSFCNQNSR